MAAIWWWSAIGQSRVCSQTVHLSFNSWAVTYGTLLTVTVKSRVHAVLEWLRAGYPGGVPGPDRVPLMALLRSTPLTDAEIRAVVKEIAAEESHLPDGHVVDYDEIAHFVEGAAHHEADPGSVKRVAATLAAAGWPLAGIDAADIWG